jgi:hypothetical protein
MTTKTNQAAVPFRAATRSRLNVLWSGIDFIASRKKYKSAVFLGKKRRP